MKQSLFIIFLFTLLVPIQAQKNHVYTVENIPKTHLMNKMQYVTDPANILSQEARDTIDYLLYKLENATGIESVVAIVPSIGNADCFEFSHELLNKWGVGKKGKDNGLVILLVTDQRCIQFYNGYGLEGDLPDAISKRIQTQIMLPYLKNGDWNNAMVSGVRAVYSRLDGSMENDEVSGGDDISLGRTILSIIVIIVLIFWLIRGGGGGLGPFIGGMLGGGLFGGNGGSGGFGGGSFGGGRGGGGGAGTRF